MLAQGIHNGSPGIVTSGTGSGKTESFMMPVLAAIVKEAATWPKAPANHIDDSWWKSDDQSFQPRRAREAKARPKAVRAIILYPLNALVEDQMTRLRRTLDSDEARGALDHHLQGNRIFFGRYTSATKVTGYLEHPRRGDDPNSTGSRSKDPGTAR